MPNDPRPLRSVLFVPGNKEDWMRRAPRYNADALIFDLEDACPAAQRPEARKMVRRVTEELGRQGHTIFVRVNGLDTRQTGRDLAEVVCPELHGIYLPKVGGPEDVIGLAALLDHYEDLAGLPLGYTRIVPLTELPSSFAKIPEIAAASPRIAYMGRGSSKGGDGARALGHEWTPGGLEQLFLRGHALAAVRAAGVPYPMSGLWPLIGDLDGLRTMARSMRAEGYEGMMCIHPSHVAVINEVFSPSPKEIAAWQHIIAALAQAEAGGTTAIQIDGALIDTAHVKTARDKLAAAKRLGLLTD